MFSLMILLALQRCGGENQPDQDKFTLKVNETIDAGGIKLRLLAIEDSRCPKEMKCVWAGAAETTLFLQAQPQQDTLQLCLGSCDTLTLKGRQYAISLLEVNPYPGTGGPDAEKTALYGFSQLP